MSDIYIAGENMNLIFRGKEVQIVKQLFLKSNVWTISNELNRDPDEVSVLIIDMGKRGLLNVGKWY
ncbi:hypothetical protein [Bacillus chungangensis]|uniref:Uncharacterized protein n=1 Tax=Bacillus chungangensis TaxID=587633 RepID=A0ABT9WRU1_9BACI|nr:hypothetical protein [Bacillus chungangensis]MDQ0176017.1 hypothetical protein [Bacillus chungangensis]